MGSRIRGGCRETSVTVRRCSGKIVLSGLKNTPTDASCISRENICQLLLCCGCVPSFFVLSCVRVVYDQQQQHLLGFAVCDWRFLLWTFKKSDKEDGVYIF